MLLMEDPVLCTALPTGLMTFTISFIISAFTFMLWSASSLDLITESGFGGGNLSPNDSKFSGADKMSGDFDVCLANHRSQGHTLDNKYRIESRRIVHLQSHSL